jgi:hypothetical protein
MQKCKFAKMQKNLPFWQKNYARTDGAARAKSNSFELCRVATEEDD